MLAVTLQQHDLFKLAMPALFMKSIWGSLGLEVGSLYLYCWQFCIMSFIMTVWEHLWSGIWCTSQWRHNERDSLKSPASRLFTQLFIQMQFKVTPKLCVTSLCVPVTGEFPAQRASTAENVSIWWRHHAKRFSLFKEKVYWWNELWCVFICCVWHI